MPRRRGNSALPCPRPSWRFPTRSSTEFAQPPYYHCASRRRRRASRSASWGRVRPSAAIRSSHSTANLCAVSTAGPSPRRSVHEARSREANSARTITPMTVIVRTCRGVPPLRRSLSGIASALIVGTAGWESSRSSATISSEPEIDERRDPLGAERVDDRDDDPRGGAEAPDRRAFEGGRDTVEQRIRGELAGEADRDQRDRQRPGLLQPLAPTPAETGDEQSRHREILGPEKDPGEADEMEHDESRDDLPGRGVRAPAEPGLQHPLDRGPAAMQGAPGDELPRGAVPHPAEQHRQHQIAVRLPPAAPVAAERLVEIVAQPGGERDVPALPEIGRASCR